MVTRSREMNRGVANRYRQVHGRDLRGEGRQITHWIDRLIAHHRDAEVTREGGQVRGAAAIFILQAHEQDAGGFQDRRPVRERRRFFRLGAGAFAEPGYSDDPPALRGYGVFVAQRACQGGIGDQIGFPRERGERRTQPTAQLRDRGLETHIRLEGRVDRTFAHGDEPDAGEGGLEQRHEARRAHQHDLGAAREQVGQHGPQNQGLAQALLGPNHDFLPGQILALPVGILQAAVHAVALAAFETPQQLDPSLREAPLRQQRARALIAGIGVVRLAREDAVVVAARGFGLPADVEQRAHVAQRGRKVGLKFQRSARAGFRFGVMLEAQQDRAQVAGGVGVVRRERRHAPEVALRVGKAAGPQQSVAEVLMSVLEIGLERDRMFDKRDALGAALLAQEHAEQMQSIHVLRVGFEDLAVSLLGSGEVAAAVQVDGGLHEGIHVGSQFLSAAAAAASGSAQDPGAVCRNSRAEGYHGLSVRSRNQYQWAPRPVGASTHTGLARAPAICTVVLLTEITRSMAATWAAKGSRSPEESMAGSTAIFAPARAMSPAASPY